jgi:hypothetical protein
MATLYIDEYSTVATVGQNLGPAFTPVQAGVMPSLVSQNVAIGGSSAQSSAFNGKTLLIRVHTDVICSIAIGSNPTAVTTATRMAANQTEYFGVPPNTGYKIAVIANT